MLTPKIQALAQFKAKVEKLERSIKAERRALLARLHEEVGLESREALIKALREVEDSSARRTPKGGRAGTAKRRRTTITPELRDAIITAVKGGATGGAAAARFKVSLPTVQNIKRAAGLTRQPGRK